MQHPFGIEIDIDHINEEIKTNYFQKFSLNYNHENKDIDIIPADRELNTIKYMKQTFLNENLNGKNVLDIGCNFGLFCLLSAKYGATCVGIEPSEKAVDIGKHCFNLFTMYPNFLEDNQIIYLNENFSDSVVKHHKYDYIICCSVYHYMWGTIQDHDKIFQILYAAGGDIFFEDALDMTDYSCNEFFEREHPDKKDEYTKEKILNAARKYYDVTYLGDHINGTRHIYWMKRKNIIGDIYTIFENDVTGVKVTKCQDENGNFYCRKIISEWKNLKMSEIIRSYEKLYPKIKDIENIVKIESFTLLDDKRAEIIMNFVPGIPVNYKEYDKFAKSYVFKQMLKIMINLYNVGILYYDVGAVNFLVDKYYNVTLIDLDILREAPTEKKDNRQIGYFIDNLMNFFEWRIQ